MGAILNLIFSVIIAMSMHSSTMEATQVDPQQVADECMNGIKTLQEETLDRYAGNTYVNFIVNLEGDDETGAGGLVLVEDGGTLYASNCTFRASSATYGGAANHAVNKERNMFATGQDQQRDGFYCLLKHRIDIIRHTLRQEPPCHLEQAEAGQSRQHTAKHKQQQTLHADQRKIVQEINYCDVEDNGEQCGDELHQRSLSETIISLPWRPAGNPSGANR